MVPREVARSGDTTAPRASRWAGWITAFAALAVVALAASQLRPLDDAPHDEPSPAPAEAARPASHEASLWHAERPSVSRLPVLPSVAGPWGEIERERLTFAPPPGYITTEECTRWHLQPWRFAGYAREHVERLLERATSDTAQRALVLAATHCDDLGCTTLPTYEMLDGFDASARGVLYDTLAAWPDNAYQVHATRRHRQHGPWHTMPGLSPRARAVLAQSTWLRGDTYHFADIPWLCARLPTEPERQRALEVLHTRYGLAAWIKVGPATPVEPLVAWWGHATSPEYVRGLVSAAASVPGGGKVPVAELLPLVIRRRLGTFPGPDEPPFDCFWTALHFFSTTTSGYLPGTDDFRVMLEREYEPIPFDQVRLGDVIVLSTPDGTPAHAVSHVAGDLVVTKNGGYASRPWVLSSLDDVRVLYPLATNVRAWRLRPLEGAM